MDVFNFECRPEQKHGEALAFRNQTSDLNSNSVYQTIMNVLKDTNGLVETTPISLYGFYTREYCLIPCPDPATEPKVIKAIQQLRGQGWYVEIFHMAESLQNVNTYRPAIFICWDPKVLQLSFRPRFYSLREPLNIPCGLCSKHSLGNIATCEGCPTLRLWLAGVAGMRKSKDPCTMCAKSKNSNISEVPTCDGCPAKDLWLSIKASNESATSEPVNNKEKDTAE